MKTCTVCTLEKPVSEFYTRVDGRSKDGLEYHCKTCHKNKKKKWYKKNKSNADVRYKNLKSTAKQRGLIFDLTIDQYSDLIKSTCHYCDSDINIAGSSLDRKDSNIGYIIENVVSCCTACNLGKNEHFTYEEWLIAMKAVKNFRNGGEHQS